MDAAQQDTPRGWLARGFSLVEDVVYVGLGILLAGFALTLLGTGALSFSQHVMAWTVADNVVELLDSLLLVLLIVEVLFTVQVSFREHTLAPEPFLIVGLIAVIRRLLVLLAELPELLEKADRVLFQQVLLEMGLLAVLILSIVASLVLLRRRPSVVAER